MNNLTSHDEVPVATWGDIYREKATEAQASTSDIEITIRGEFTQPPPEPPQPPEPKPQK
jgi:hypothetical protein